MKKKLLLITAAALVCGGNAMAEDQPQIPNGDFETWTENLPNNWNSFQTADGSLAGSGYDSSNRQVGRSTDTRPGSTGQYSCDIWAREINAIFFKVIAQGNLTTGRVHAGSMLAANKDNYNYTDRTGAEEANGKAGEPCAMKFTGKPKAVKVWVKYVQGGTGYGEYATAKFSAVIHGDGDYISYGLPEYDNNENKALVVASVAKEIEYTGGNWVELNLPFEYTNNGATPAYIQINASTNAYPGKGKKGDHLYIDDIEMVYESAADNVIALINAIGTVAYTDASKAKIDAARTAYDALTADEKNEVAADVLKVLTNAETKYAELKQAAEEAAAQAEADKKAADAAVKKITAIGEVAYTDESKGKIDAARTAYDALTDAQKTLVTKETLAVLTDAEKTYADLKQAADEAAAQAEADKKAADAAVEKINAIGEVEYTDDSKAKIDAARTAYNALTDAQKALVTKETVAVLTDAETKYADLKQAADEAAAQAAADKDAADAAVKKITAIGEVTYTDESKGKIDAARAAYNNLTDAQKALVSADVVKVLTDAEAAYAELEQVAAQAAKDKAAADAAVAKINAIGTVEYNDASKQKIDAARTAYNNLTDAQKALVSADAVKTLTDAEAAYAQLKQAAEEAAAQAAADKKAAEAAVASINAIGEVEYTDESKGKIDAARKAYDALTDAQKALVTKETVAVLTAAEARYAELEEQAKKEAADKAAAENAITHINSIGTVEYTGESKQKIDAARTAYDALTDAQKVLVSADVVKVLTAAEAAYAELEQAADQAAKDKTAADAAIAKINAIGTVEYSDASKAKIDAARAAYDALTDAQKTLVSADVVNTLTDAETRYAELKQAAEEAAAQAAKDKAAADAAIAKINAIGTVEYNDASKQKIGAAREAYDALTDAQKTLVTASDLAKLTTAEDTYAQLKKQAEEAAQQAEQAAKELAEAKTALGEGISEAKKYYESIKADYAGVAATLQAAINAAAEVLNSATVTKAQADDAKAALAAAVKKAQTDVTVITGIKTVKTTKAASANDVWYDMIGNRLPGKPHTKGIYIKNGRKVVIR